MRGNLVQEIPLFLDGLKHEPGSDVHEWRALSTWSVAKNALKLFCYPACQLARVKYDVCMTYSLEVQFSNLLPFISTLASFECTIPRNPVSP